MDASRLRRGLEAHGLSLPEERLERLLLYLDELLRWNRRVNLTSITQAGQAEEKHLIDSLTLLPLLGEGKSLLDIGSGAGLPALPLKIARPELDVVSVDSVQKKILFQRHVARRLGLEGFSAVHGRIENLADSAQLDRLFCLITSRALADLETFLGWAAPFAGAQSRIVAMKGPEGEREWREAHPAIEALNLRLQDLVRLELPFSGSLRTLLIFTKS